MSADNDELGGEWDALRSLTKPAAAAQPGALEELQQSWFQRYGLPEEAWYVYTGHINSFRNVQVLRVRLIKPYNFNSILKGWCVKTLGGVVINRQSPKVEVLNITKARRFDLYFTFEELEMALATLRKKHLEWARIMISSATESLRDAQKNLEYHNADLNGTPSQTRSHFSLVTFFKHASQVGGSSGPMSARRPSAIRPHADLAAPLTRACVSSIRSSTSLPL